MTRERTVELGADYVAARSGLFVPAEHAPLPPVAIDLFAGAGGFSVGFHLVFEFCRIVLDVAPKTFVMENVPAMTRMVTAEGIPVLDAIALYLSKAGYADYEALRRALSFDPTARAGIRSKNKATTPEQQPNELGPEQLDLLDATPA